MPASATRRLKRLTAQLRKEFDAATPISDAGDNWVEGWISPAVIDRDGDYIPPDEWDLSEHEKNPVALYNHERKGLEGVAIGKWQHPDGRYAVEVRDEGLYGRCYFDMADPFAAELHRKYKSGILRGFSPGFRVMGRPQRGTVNGEPATIQRDCKLFEISLVPVPANPEALATLTKAFKHRGDKIMPTPEVKIEPQGDVQPGAATEKTKAEAEVTEDAPVGGLRSFLERVVGIAGLVAEAKADLAMSDAEPELLEKAAECISPMHKVIKSVIAIGRERFPDMPWDESAKAVDDVFGMTDEIEDEDGETEGDEEDAEVESDDEVEEEVDAEAVKAFVAEYAENVVTKILAERLDLIAEAVKRQGEAIEAIGELTEAIAAS